MINNQNCFAVNFGYNGEIPIPGYSISIKTRPNLKQYNFENSNTCFFVFVGGKYVKDMKTIVDIVENITQQFHGIEPIAMFVMGKFNTSGIMDFSSFGNKLTKVAYWN